MLNIGIGPGRGKTAVAGAVSVAAVLVLQLALFPVPLGVWVQGLILGLLGSLMAVGLGLTYRLNKVVNFSQGDLGTAPAVLAVGLIGFSSVNYFLGLATGLVASVLLTATVEILVVRRFRRSPRLILTVATIGLSQLLVVIALLIPRIWGQAPISTAVVSFPWHFTWHIAPVVFNSDDLVAVIVSIGCLVGVSLWFTKTDIGIAVQAAGDRRDRASMLGIPVGRLQSVTWVVAGVLSFVTIFFQAAILGLPLDPTYGLTALVTALAALALGNFTELPVIAASAVVLGVLQQGVAWNDPADPALSLAVLAAVVFGAILVRQLFASRRDREVEASLSLAGSVRDLPSRARDLTEVKVAKPTGAAIAFAAACTLPLWMGQGELIRASALVVLAVVGCSIVVLTGWSGQVSLGQMSFAAIGGVMGAVALHRLALGPEPRLPPRRRDRRCRRGRRRPPDAAPRRHVRGGHDARLRARRLGLPPRPRRILLDPPGPARHPLPLRRLHHVAGLDLRAEPGRARARTRRASRACATAASAASCARCRRTNAPRRVTASASCGPS